MTRYRPLLLLLALLVAALPCSRPVAEESPKRAAGPPAGKLLGTGWDFSDGDLTGWHHKENATLSIAEQGGNKSLHLESAFAPHAFTWATRHFEPRSTAGVEHVTFRVRGNSSGHKLLVHLGAARPEGKGNLYYINADQAVTLDFQGWREVSLDLAQFKTPSGGLRDRDLAGVVFLEFMLQAGGSAPADLWIDDVAMTGPTPEEVAQGQQRAARQKEISTQSRAALTGLKKDLAALRDRLDALQKEGKFVAMARVYWTALDWCADDAMRLLESEEHDLVAQVPVLLDDLKKRVADSQAVLKHVSDKVPQEKDSLDSENNPYFKSVVTEARNWARSERLWVKGRKGYLSVPSAWSFAGFGNHCFTIAWSMTRPKSPLHHDPMLLRNALNLVDLIAHQHTDGDFNIDRTAIYGSDPNINRFCLVPALDAWCELEAAYPDLLPAAKRADLLAGLKRLADHQVTDYGLARVAKKAHVKQPAYPNMDVHHILIMELAYRLWHDEVYAKERDAFVKILDSAVYPMGAWAYTNTQNECFVYHHLNVVYSARYWKLSGNPVTLAMLKRTIPFYPYNVEPAGMPEYYTDACWKHYWGGGAAPGPEVMAGLFGDPLNKRVAEVCAAIWGYETGYQSAIAAEFWKPIPSKPLPDGYVIYDTNIQGARGRYGNWSFAANGRNYGVGYQGKDTFAGCMITDPPRRPMPLDSALQVVTAEVRLNHTDNHWRGGLCHSALEKLTTTTGPDFGSLAVRYTVSKPNWGHLKDTVYAWQGIQQWYLSRTRLVGLVALECTADESRAAVHGRIRLGLSRELKSLAEQTWQYGKLVVRIHGHNYARIVTKPSETFYLDVPEKYRSTEITLVDPLSVAAGEKGDVKFPKGSRYWFLVEVRPEGSPPAEAVERIESGPLAGFRFREPGRTVALLHNPTDHEAEVNVPVNPPGGTKLTIYQGNDGKGESAAGETIRTKLQPHRHLVAVVQ